MRCIRLLCISLSSGLTAVLRTRVIVPLLEDGDRHWSTSHQSVAAESIRHLANDLPLYKVELAYHFVR